MMQVGLAQSTALLRGLGAADAKASQDYKRQLNMSGNGRLHQKLPCCERCNRANEVSGNRNLSEAQWLLHIVEPADTARIEGSRPHSQPGCTFGRNGRVRMGAAAASIWAGHRARAGACPPAGHLWEDRRI